MSSDVAVHSADFSAETTPKMSERLKPLRSLSYSIFGMAILFACWWVGGRLIANNPAMMAFADFAPAPALERLSEMLSSGEAWEMTLPSLQRVLHGMAIAIFLGVPVGILIGRIGVLREITNIPFQFLRMISPLSWMPIAVMAFATWVFDVSTIGTEFLI